MMEALLVSMGLRVGVYGSPHLESVTERIRIGGEVIDADGFGRSIGSVALAADAAGSGSVTWFETLTAAALLQFADEAVDVAVVEVGMLGRHDATNVVRADVSCITNVSLDHSDGVGEWRRAIAEEKAGIIEATGTLVLGEDDLALRPIFLGEQPARAVVRGDDFEVVGDLLAVGGRLVSVRTPRGLYDEVFLNLHGSHQAENASLALTGVEEFFDAALPDEVVEEAFGSVVVPGRLEVVSRGPTVVVDTAHNVAGAAALARAVAEDFATGGRRFLLFGMQSGRVPEDVCRALRVGDYHLVVACTAPTSRGVDAAELGAAARAVGASVDVVHDVEAALDHLLGQVEQDDLVVVAGATPVVGRVRTIIDEY